MGRLLAERFPRGVHLEGDVFRRSIVSGRHEMSPDAPAVALRQLRLRYRVAAAAADTYVAAGFTVVLEDVVAGPLLRAVTRLIRSRPLHVVVLLPAPQTLAARATARGESGYTHWTVTQLHGLFERGTPRIGLWLDNSGLTPEQTVDRILASTTAG